LIHPWLATTLVDLYSKSVILYNISMGALIRCYWEK